MNNTMKTSIALVLFHLSGLTLAKPTIVLRAPTLTYATLTPGAPVGIDGRVVDTSEVTLAKIQHATAQLNEHANLVNEAARSGEAEVSRDLVSQPSLPLLRILALQDLAGTGLTISGTPLTLAPLVSDTSAAAPVGSDGRVVDTPAVARAKVEHAVAHLNEKLNLSNEATRNAGLIAFAAPSAIALRL